MSTSFIGIMQGDSGARVRIAYDLKVLRIRGALDASLADAAIMSRETGFSPLGASLDDIAEELGISSQFIRSLADQEDTQGTHRVIGFTSARQGSRLKGVVLTPRDPSNRNTVARSDDRFVSRDFYYAISYEAFRIVSVLCEATKVVITHLSPSQAYHTDIATCTVEALGHFLDAPTSDSLHSGKTSLSELTFIGCCIEESHFSGLSRIAGASRSPHRPLNSKTSTKRLPGGGSVITSEFRLER